MSSRTCGRRSRGERTGIFEPGRGLSRLAGFHPFPVGRSPRARIMPQGAQADPLPRRFARLANPGWGGGYLVRLVDPWQQLMRLRSPLAVPGIEVPAFCDRGA